MAKINPISFNPNLLSPWNEDEQLNFNLAVKLKLKNIDSNQTPNEIVDEFKAEFIEKYELAMEIIKKADPDDILSKIYTKIPLMPKVQYQIHDEKIIGHGLNVASKIGGIPDLRSHSAMSYLDIEGVSVEDVISKIWPKNPNGRFLNCLGTVNTDANMHILSRVTREPSAFENSFHSFHTFLGDVIIFAPWCPDFNSHLDVCVMTLRRKTSHNISDEEYLKALENLGLLEEKEDYSGDKEPLSYHVVSNPQFGFDLECYNGDWIDELKVVPKKYEDIVYEISRNVLTIADTYKNNPFASRGLQFGGAPESQQTPQRYMDINPFPTPHRMTPFAGFSSPFMDMHYQIYISQRPEQYSFDTYFGKLDASCT